MSKKKKGKRKKQFSTSGYKGSRKRASTGQSAGRKNKFITLRHRYGDLRRAFGMAGG